MKLFNTMSRKTEVFKPLEDKMVKLYSCGPTVYDYPHVGNWSIFVRYDTLVRTLKASGYHVNWIMNVTDVGHLVSDADEGEDKLEKGARREGKSAWDIANFYTDDFKAGLRALNISLPLSSLHRATDHIAEQIDLIKALEKKGFIYVIDDGVYFDTRKLADYGKLARLRVEELKPGARVAINIQKRNPHDFALWKFSPKDKKRDMEWESPWGKGFPGWHLECSAISMRYLGDTFDIHAGGIDHIPIHHTNEIAQSEAATGKPLAKYWVHGNFFTVNGTKISKSLGNSITLRDIDKRGHPLMAYRLLVLQSHYRAQADFSWDNLAAAENRLKALQGMADLRFQPVKSSKVKGSHLEETKQAVLGNLQDDLNTPEALATLSNLERLLENDAIDESTQAAFNNFVQWLDEIFGLRLSASEDITPGQKDLLKKREAARDKQDWQESDLIRAELAKQGIEVRDTPKGQLWRRL